MNLDKFIGLPPYSLEASRKTPLFLKLINELHLRHLKASDEYRKMSEVYFNCKGEASGVEDMPFLPVSLFKTKELKSISDEEVYKVLTSSGTSGQVPSRVLLDRDTARLQTLALSRIISNAIGSERLPMIIVDSRSVLKDRKAFSARGAGILGLSVFGRNHLYMLDEEFNPDLQKLKEFADKFNGQPMLIFGFTFMVWQYLMEIGLELDLSNSFLIHSGGWKKLQELEVDNETFKQGLADKFGIKPRNIYNFYGMVEQVGSVYLENSQGYLHAPNFSDIIIRNPEDFSVQPVGKEGLIQAVSLLPLSYPGHSILTEDIGVVMGTDDADNGWKGKYFRILGRVNKAEMRGCSDTFEV